MSESLQNIKKQRLRNFYPGDIPVDVLRLDLFHPVVSGNKWFKLRYHLEEIKNKHQSSVATFGGAFSNHIVATAYAAAEMGIPSLGLIRGDEGMPLSPTLQDARAYGMELVFINREDFRNKEVLLQKWNVPGRHWIMEGGYGATGARGAESILDIIDTSDYTHIVCAVGTGTMMAGLINHAAAGQQVTGIVVLKHSGIEKEIRDLLNDPLTTDFSLHHDYHFGGYAKRTPELLEFMRECWSTQLIPTDIVYTGKLLFGTRELLVSHFFPAGSSLLIIHSGGLQGNRSLPPGVLPF